MAQLDLTKLKAMVVESNDLTSVARELAERDRDYYDDHQWTEDEKLALQQKNQPVITMNRIKRKVDAMVGIEQQSRVDPRAYPRNPQDEESADAATKALVFVDDNTRFDSKKSAAFENMIVEGYGGVEVGVEEKRGKYEITITRLRWEEIFFDPHSREKDFSDAQYIGVMKWMSMDAALSMYSGIYDGEEEALEELLSATGQSEQDGETFEDRPFQGNSFRWTDKRMKRVRVAQMYYKRGGKWYLSIFTGGGEIYSDVSSFEDEDGQPTCPIILMTAYIDRENRRYGVVRSMISAQDEINKRRSKALHFFSARQTMGVKGSVDSIGRLKAELADPNGHVEINIEQFEDAARAGIRPFELMPTNDLGASQFSMLNEAKQEIDMIGPNASLLGQLTGDQSGRAIMAQQQAGFAELAPIYDSLRDWNLRVYRAVWERIKQFWTEERWVRVTDARGATEFVGLNAPTGQMQVVQTQEGPALTPMLQNAVAEMDLDIIIDDAPDHVTLQHEAFEQLTQLAQAGIPIPPEMLVENSSVRNKAELLEKMEEQQQAAMQQQMQMAQLGQAQTQAEIQKTQSESRENEADAFKKFTEANRLAQGF